MFFMCTIMANTSTSTNIYFRFVCVPVCECTLVLIVGKITTVNIQTYKKYILNIRSNINTLIYYSVCSTLPYLNTT